MFTIYSNEEIELKQMINIIQLLVNFIEIMLLFFC
jgi:hypothetical protein